MFRPDAYFLADLFATCSVRPIIIVSMEFMASAEALREVLAICKVLSYNRFNEDGGRQARFIVDLSGSRAATSGITPYVSRVRPVHIGKISDPEATKYVSTRTPKTIKDPKKQAEITNLIVTLFDAHVATLQRVCKDLRLKMPTDMDVVTCTLGEIQALQEDNAAEAWVKYKSRHATQRSPNAGGRKIRENG
jgi:hypothetical protein